MGEEDLGPMKTWCPSVREYQGEAPGGGGGKLSATLGLGLGGFQGETGNGDNIWNANKENIQLKRKEHPTEARIDMWTSS